MVDINMVRTSDRSPHSWGRTLMLVTFFGFVGAHEFYLGNKVLGWIKIL